MRISLWIALTCTGFACQNALAREAETAAFVPGVVLVRFEHPVTPDQAALLLDAGLFTVDQRIYDRLSIYRVKLSEGLEVPEALELLDRNKNLRWAQADHLTHERDTVPDDPMFPSQWNMSIISAPQAWDLGTGGVDVLGRQIVTAICDGGMEMTHPELSGNLWVNTGETPGNGVDDDGNGYIDDVNGWDGYNNDGSIPTNGHGTHVSGIAGASGNNGTQVCGINWNSTLMPVACSSNSTSIVSTGNNYVANMKALWFSSQGAQGANIVSTNSSFGVNQADCQSGSYPIWNDLYDDMGALGILSAGATANANFNVDVVGDVPTSCSSDWLITVTNTTSVDVKYSQAGYGLTTIDLGAPGTSVLSTYTGGSTSTLTGTSMATPHVTGAISYLHSVASADFANYYMLFPAEAALLIKQWIMDGTDQLAALDGITVSGGRLNLAASAALAAAFNNGPSPLMDLTAPSLSFSLPANASETAQLSLANVGEEGSSLNWSVTIREPVQALRDMTGSLLEVPQTSYSSTDTLVLDLSALNGSADQEWMAAVTLELPTGVTVISASNLVSDVEETRFLSWDGINGASVVHWIDQDGGWGNIFPSEHALGRIFLDASGASGSIEFTWTIEGDVFGGEPHTVTGGFGLDPSGPGISVGQPLDGANWPIGSQHNITWNTHLVDGPIMIRLSRNAGLDWETLASDESNDGSYPWLVSGPPTSEALVEVSLPSEALADVSGMFRISQPLTWLSINPQSGELADGLSQVLGLDLDTADLFPGSYSAELFFQSNSGNQILPVQLLVTAGGDLEAPLVQILSGGGIIQLSWPSVPGALSYRVEGRQTSADAWHPVETVDGTSWQQPLSLGMSQFRVIALQ
ncbi:MAG: S8 family serine peptidase [Candidatus Cloacimonetes bacterium]|nr:S8 family serine peptidase [Candidatus Cloacimonadota bacterium]